tara:strand:- start:262 stop:1695 length:1434 start_codon:yes stop_codon:yes gene_type:complete
MKFLYNIIQSLSKEEIRFYKLFVGRTKQSKERKDLILFDLIKNSPSEDVNKKAIDKLKVKSNNYYQLKNRVYHDLNNSIVWQHISKDHQSQSFSFVLLSRVYKNKGELEIAYHYLKTAEKEGIKNELYEILSIVYSEIIELSNELISVDLDHYLKLKKENSLVVQEIDEIDALLAKLMYDIKTKQNFAKSDASVLELLSKYYKENAKKKTVLDSPRFRLRLFKMYSRLLLQKKDYTSLEQFLVRTYNDFVSDGLFNRSNHNDKLTLLTYLTNCFYKTKQYSKSLEFAEILNVAMKEFDGFLNEKYVFYYFNSLVLNYAIEDKEKALDVLKEAKNNASIKKLPAYISFIYLNTSLIYFQQEKYSLASTNISRLIQQDDFLSLDKVFQLKLLIVELIIRLELNQEDRILKQVRFINKEYKSLLSQDQLKRDAQVLELIVMVLNKEDISSKVESITSSKSDEQSRSIDIISYNDWMKTLL